MDAKIFLTTLKQCVQEYKKQMGDTRSEPDAAYFFDKTLKNFIIKNKDEFSILSTMNFDRSFVTFVNTYLIGK